MNRHFTGLIAAALVFISAIGITNLFGTLNQPLRQIDNSHDIADKDSAISPAMEFIARDGVLRGPGYSFPLTKTIISADSKIECNEAKFFLANPADQLFAYELKNAATLIEDEAVRTDDGIIID